VEADAQVAPLAELCGGPVDRVISRYGIMFFDDPVAAFANMRAALQPEGRLTFITWRPVSENPWMAVPGHALVEAVGRSFVTPPAGPGPFGLADRGHVEPILTGAGFRSIAFEPLDLPIAIGGGLDAEAAAAFGFDALTQFLPEGGAEIEDRDAAVAAVRRAFAPYEDEHGHVVLPSSSWIVSAEG
jgi:SAM-dependent methyltransferase